jgi:peroxiredoxin
MKRVVTFLLVTASVVFAAGELSHRRAPGFSLPDAAQQQHDLADYRGKYLILDFMQTHCPHCIAFSEVIEKLMVKYRTKLGAVSVVVPPDNLATATAYIKDHNITVPILFDCGQMTASYLKIGPSRPTVTFPHVFIVDPAGNLINDWAYTAGNENIFERDGFIKEIDKLMSGK